MSDKSAPSSTKKRQASKNSEELRKNTKQATLDETVAGMAGKSSRYEVSLKDELKAALIDPEVIVSFKNILQGWLDEKLTELSAGLEVQFEEKLKQKDREITVIKQELSEMRQKYDSEIAALQDESDEQQQYSRRNVLVIAGKKETEGESTDNIVLELARKMGVGTSAADISRSHRLGRDNQRSQSGSVRRNGQSSQPQYRPIVVKFTTYNARSEFIRQRKTLKDVDAGVYINESLTKRRAKLFKAVRDLGARERVKGYWTYDGKIYLKDWSDKVHQVKDMKFIQDIRT